MQRMAAVRNNPPCHIRIGFAPERRRQGLAGVDASAVQVALAAREPPQTLGARRGVEHELDVGEAFVELGDGGEHDAPHPHRIRADAARHGGDGTR